MDSPTRIPITNRGEPQHVLLSPCSSSSTATDSNSPEFEFWMVRNPSFPQPNLLSADQLFVDGVLLPLHLLHLHNNNPAVDPPDRDEPAPEPEPQHEPGPKISRASITTEATTTTLSASKRWKDMIFKKTTTTKKKEDKDGDKDKNREKEKEKKRERRNQSGGSSGSSSSSSSTAELNINIWPFSRSRSAGNSYFVTTRPKVFSGTRKVSSAPCSRSNSGGESKSRKWPSSPGRAGGVHLGRSSPVWQVRRGGGGEKGAMHYASKKEVTEPRRSKTTTPARVLNLNVPICIGYRQHLTCRSHESNAIVGVGSISRGKNGSESGGTTNNTTDNIVGNGGNLFNFRSFFAKKVY